MFFKKKKAEEQDQEPYALWSMLAKLPTMNSMRREIAGAAGYTSFVDEWFDETQDILKFLSKDDYEQLRVEGLDKKKVKELFSGSSIITNTRLEKNPRKPIPFDQSTIAPVLLQKLDEAGIPYTTPRSTLDAEGWVQTFEALYGDDAEKWPSPNRLTVSLGLASGRVIVSEIEFYQDEKGEFAYWYTDLLVSNLPFCMNKKIGEDWVDSDSYSAWLIADKLFLPTNLSNLAFLAENRLPTLSPVAPIMFPRSYFFSDEGSGETHNTEKLLELLEETGTNKSSAALTLLPAPGFLMLKNSSCRAAAQDSQGEYHMIEFVAPNSVRFGWTFDLMSIKTTISVNAFRKMFRRAAECVDDGYSAFRGAVQGDDAPNPLMADYHFIFFRNDVSVLDANAREVPSDKLGGCPTWIPTSHAGLLVGDSWEKREVLEGIGPGLYYGIADLVFDELIPKLIVTSDGSSELASEHETILDQIERLCGAALLLPVPSQQSNALSNAGVARYQVGDLELAKQRLLLALDHPSKNNEAEASFVLGHIYSELGDTSEAKKYFDRSEIAGGYPARGWFRSSPLRSGSSKVSSGFTKNSKPGFATEETQATLPDSPDQGLVLNGKTDSKVKKFCTNCGEGFSRLEEKFCPQCGEKR